LRPTFEVPDGTMDNVGAGRHRVQTGVADGTDSDGVALRSRS